jgi:hypothetical protein
LSDLNELSDDFRLKDFIMPFLLAVNEIKPKLLKPMIVSFNVFSDDVRKIHRSHSGIDWSIGRIEGSWHLQKLFVAKVLNTQNQRTIHAKNQTVPGVSTENRDYIDSKCLKLTEILKVHIFKLWMAVIFVKISSLLQIDLWF